jgi:DAACS family dicarboxylate/amino acid:cation (Na+ or H+) symporter
MQLHTRILLGLAAGAAAGTAANLAAGQSHVLSEVVRLGTEPLGKMWLSALVMMVIPLILSTLALGVVGLGDVRRLGKIGLVTLGCFLGLTAISAAVGLALTGLLEPGRGLDPAIKESLLALYKGQAQEAMGLSGGGFGIDLLVKIIPRNPIAAAASGDMLAVIVFSLIFGGALASIAKEKAEPMIRLLDSLGEVTLKVIELAMAIAPVGVFCLIFSVIARFGFTLLVSLLWYLVTILSGLALVLVVVYPIILRLIAGRSPLEFFRGVRLVMLTAFTTSSSNATLPTTLSVARDRLAIPASIGGFVLPLGATINMNGTALFEGGTVLFIAQVFGVKLTLGAQAIVVAMSVVTAIGTAGIPGGSIPLLMMVLKMVGVPMEGIAIVLGVDRILDMCRTVLNVTGDLVTSTVVTRAVGLPPAPAPASSDPPA